MRPSDWRIVFFAIARVIVPSALLVLGAFFGTCAFAAETTLLEGWTIDRFAWRGALEAAREIVVDNPHGDIRARRSDDAEVELLAVIQHADDDPRPPRVVVEREGERIVIRVDMPDRGTPGANTHGVEADRRRVDISLFVPPSARLDARTRGGLIDAKKLGSDIVARSERGEIRVATEGTVDLENEHGPVIATLLADRWSSPPAISSATGMIELWLPTDVDAEVVAETRGLITTDFAIDMAYDEKTAIKRATARVGAATAAIRLSSAKGDVRILRSAIRPSDR